MSITVSAILVAAGQGTRFGQDKILLRLNKKTVLQRTLEKFLPLLSSGKIAEIVIVVSAKNRAEIANHLADLNYLEQVKLVEGGNERWHSSLQGIKAAQGELVLIHDVARPFVSQIQIQAAIQKALVSQPVAALVAIPCSNSVKLVNEHGQNVDSLPRNQVWLAQTPQVFNKELILQGYKLAAKANYETMTDESELITKFLQQPVCIVPGSEENMKITFTTDIPLATRIAENEDLLYSEEKETDAN